MFWAVTCEAGKRYSQKAKEPFRITMAALEPRDKLPENKQVSLMLEHGGKEFLLCTLEHDRVMQCRLDLKFSEGEEPCFFVSGEGTIHLSGFHMEPESSEGKKIDIYSQPSTSRAPNFHEDESEEVEAEEEEEEEDTSEDDDGIEEAKQDIGVDMLLTHMDDSDDDEEDSDYNPLTDLQKQLRGKMVQMKTVDDNDVVCLNSGDEDDDDEEDSDVLDDENDEGIAGAGSSKKRKKNLVALTMKRAKHEGKKMPLVAFAGIRKSSGNNAAEDGDSSDSEEDGEDMNSSIGHTPMPKKVVGILKNGNQSASKSFSSPSLKPDKGKQPLLKKNMSSKPETYSQCLPSGVQYEDVRVGNGPMAKNGKMLHVYYVGKLEDGKVFDSTKEGKDKPFTLRLGKNEVISGWDEGLIGMKVGGKRKLKIPPKMGYGNRKMPGIPPNSTLYFTVDLKAAS